MEEEPAAAEPGRGPEPGTLSRLIREIAADEAAGEVAWAPALAPGKDVGRFRLLRELGRGGFGVVFEAEDQVLRRRVALKAVRTGPRTALRSERLLEEAEAAARLAHPNIVTLHDLGRSEHGPYLVLELLDGEVLHERLARGPLTPAEAVRIATGIARGLAHAHARGVVHRDLKPGNVFLTRDGQVKVLDFGLAHAFGISRIEGGTPAYMAPEQREGRDEDERADVFALGVLLHRMLSGRLPFDPGVDGPAPALELPGLPALGELVGLMLECDPAHRPRDGREVLRALEALDAILRAAGAAAPGPEAVALRAGRPSRGWRLAAWTALALTLAGAGTVGLLVLRGQPAPARGAPRTVVAVADVENRTGEPELDGLAGLLSTSLEQSRRLEVLTVDRMYELARQAGRPVGSRIDEQIGQEICRRAAATALVASSVHRLGAVYAVEVRGIEPGRSAYLFSHRETVGTREGILGALDRLAERARASLSEPPAEVAASRVSVGEAVTGSLEAYAHYARAREEYRRIEYAAAVKALGEALRVDPGFALAHFELARIGRDGELPRELAAGHLAEAVRLQQRLPAKERRVLSAWRLVDGGDLAAAEAEYASLAADFPNEADVAYALGALLARQDRTGEAVPHLQRALALRPADILAGSDLVYALAWLGRAAEGVAIAERNRAALPGPATAVILAEALEAVGRFEEAARLGAEALAGGEPQGRSRLLSASHRAEDFATVEREAGLLARAADADLRARGVLNLASTFAWQGRRREALRELARPEDGDYPGFYTRWRVMLLAGLERPEELGRAAERLAGLDPENAARTAAAAAWSGEAGTAALLARRLTPSSMDGRLHAAAVAWRAGDPRALPELRALSGTHATGELLDLFLYGEAALEAGDAEGARAALERFLALNVRTGWAAWAKPRARLRLAQALERLGRREEAVEIARRLALTWTRADENFPGLAELRELEGRLAR